MLDRAAWIGGTLLLAVVAFSVTWILTSRSSVPDAAVAPPEPTGEPDVVWEFDPPMIPTTPQPVGSWMWWELGGGECLAELLTPDRSSTLVVDCDTEHRARYLNPVVISHEETDPFPGADQLLASANTHCQSLTAAGLGIGSDIEDLITEGIVVVDEQSWQAGLRVMGCVVSRGGGGLLPAWDTVESGSGQ